MKILMACWLGLAGSSMGAEFELMPRAVLIPERGYVKGTILVAGQAHYGFIPPSGLVERVEPDQRKVSYRRRDQGATMSFELAGPNAGLTPKIREELLEEQVRKRFPGGQILERFECYAGTAGGGALTSRSRWGKGS